MHVLGRRPRSSGVLEAMNASAAAAALSTLDANHAAEMLTAMTGDAAVSTVAAMTSNKAAAVLGSMDIDVAAGVLGKGADDRIHSRHVSHPRFHGRLESYPFIIMTEKTPLKPVPV